MNGLTVAPANSIERLSLDFDTVTRLAESVEFHAAISQQFVPVLILAFGEEILDETIHSRVELSTLYSVESMGMKVVGSGALTRSHPLLDAQSHF